MLDLTVSIVNHKNRDMLERLLTSIVGHTQNARYEVVVVDNASGDGSVDMLTAQFPNVRVICSDVPRGYAANQNAGLGQLTSRYYALLNDDMSVLPNALDELVGFLDSSPDVGMVGCRLLNPDGTTQRSCWNGFPCARTLAIDLFYLSRLLPRISWVRSFEASQQEPDGPVQVDHLLGACMVVRADAVAQVGPLDETFGMFLEETDWCYRFSRLGWRICWHPGAAMLHYGQSSVGKTPRIHVPMLYRNYIRFARKHHYSRCQIALMKLVIVSGSLFRAGVWAARLIRGRYAASDMLLAYLSVPRVVLCC